MKNKSKMVDKLPANDSINKLCLKVAARKQGVWSNINTRYLVWRCGDGRSFAL
jgi:hypothetical protein